MNAAYAVLDALAGLVDPPVAMAAAVVANDQLDDAYDLANEQSRFEFGSIGKTMTAQILADLVVAGVVTLDDPTGEWLDAGDNGDITLGELATHTSGLLRMPPNYAQGDLFDPADPYASYSADLAEAALRDMTLVAPGQREYSNFGYSVLGVVLVRITAMPFGDLLRKCVFDPFGLETATVGPGPNQVQGYANGEPTAAWNFLLAGPGGVCGTLDDLVSWGEALLDPTPALRFAIDNRLAWNPMDDGVLWHNGGTYGGHACVVADPAAKRVAATVIATGDLGHVDEATFLACRGEDPFRARPEPVDDRCHAPAVELADLLAAQRWDDARARMTESCAAALTAERLSEAWREVMAPRGEYQAAAVTNASLVQGAVTVHLDLAFSNGTGHAEVYFDDDTRVIGLRIA